MDAKFPLEISDMSWIFFRYNSDDIRVHTCADTILKMHCPWFVNYRYRSTMIDGLFLVFGGFVSSMSLIYLLYCASVYNNRCGVLEMISL